MDTRRVSLKQNRFTESILLHPELRLLWLSTYFLRASGVEFHLCVVPTRAAAGLKAPHVAADDRRVKLRAQLRRALLRFEVDIHDAEAFAVAVGPSKLSSRLHRK